MEKKQRKKKKKRIENNVKTDEGDNDFSKSVLGTDSPGQAVTEVTNSKEQGSTDDDEDKTSKQSSTTPHSTADNLKDGNADALITSDVSASASALQEQEQEQEQQQQQQQKADALIPSAPSAQGKTEAQLRYEEGRRKRLEERLRREGIKTHKERVEELNRYLSNLSEHHDM